MATDFPGTGVDSFDRPVSGVDSQDNPDSAVLANNHSDAIEALQTKVGPGTATATEGKILRGAATAGNSEWASRDLVFVAHGATAGTVRPSYASRVLWEGSVDPTNATAGDFLWRTDREMMFRFDGTNWLAAGKALLSSVGYAAVSDSSYTTTSVSMVDVDATNLVLPDFVVPASGRVLVKMSALGNAGAATLRWNIRQGSSDVSGTTNIVLEGSTNIRCNYEAIVSGLTPGATISGWKMGFRSNGSATVTIYHGGSSRGQIVMEVWAA